MMKPYTAFLVCLLACAGVIAQQPPAEQHQEQSTEEATLPPLPPGVYRIGPMVSSPRALRTPDPEYSADARKRHIEGTVLLSLIVDKKGKARDVRVQRRLEPGLDRNALEAVRRWRFKPAMFNGQPVPVQMNVEVSFYLY